VTPWEACYYWTRRVSAHAPVSGDIVALCMLLEVRGAQTVGQVKAELGLASTGAADVVRRAEAQGYVVTTRLPGDARVRIVDLSPMTRQRLKTVPNDIEESTA
jgi:DNA-binding MarR family transcriptional regulator